MHLCSLPKSPIQFIHNYTIVTTTHPTSSSSPVTFTPMESCRYHHATGVNNIDSNLTYTTGPYTLDYIYGGLRHAILFSGWRTRGKNEGYGDSGRNYPHEGLSWRTSVLVVRRRSDTQVQLVYRKRVMCVQTRRQVNGDWTAQHLWNNTSSCCICCTDVSHEG